MPDMLFKKDVGAAGSRVLFFRGVSCVLLLRPNIMKKGKEIASWRILSLHFSCSRSIVPSNNNQRSSMQPPLPHRHSHRLHHPLPFLRPGEPQGIPAPSCYRYILPVAAAGSKILAPARQQR
jgi:hypothetical protein